MAKQAVKIIGLQGVLKTLKSLPPEIVSKRGGPVRTALRKASLLIVNQAKANVERITSSPNPSGFDSQSTGLLAQNIVTARDNKMRGGERYTVRVRKKSYPPSRGTDRGRGISTLKVGALLESGSERREPMPWMRPAYEAKKHQVLIVFSDEINKSLARIVKKLATQNGVK